MTRPTLNPAWATDANNPAGSNPWSGQPNKVDPGAVRNGGFQPQSMLPAEFMNYILGAHGQWINYQDDAVAGIGLYRLEDDLDQGQLALTASGYLPNSSLYFTQVVAAPQLAGLTSSGLIGGYGVAVFKAPASGVAATATLGSGSLDLGTAGDYDLYFRLSVTTRANLATFANHGIYFGLSLSGAAQTPAFLGGSGNNSFSNNHWLARDYGGVDHDSGVAITDGQFYKFRILRRAGTITFYIDGVSVYTTTDTNQMNGSLFLGQVSNLAMTANGAVANLDYVRLYAWR